MSGAGSIRTFVASFERRLARIPFERERQTFKCGTRSSAVFFGTGGSSGDVIHVTVTRLRGIGPLRLTVPTGSILRSARASVQDMVIRAVRGRLTVQDGYYAESSIAVNSDQPVTTRVVASIANCWWPR